ncbi:MAG TPA: methylmalonyl-CoA mutase family protein, partial [Cyclobacteriaceae bacterium]|nr:methylmalonyl-CoA mutase family protein [Cyclobacteriaceae bacterium]
MPENKFQLDFNALSVRDWEKIAQQELANKNPWKNLTREKRGLTIKPYYDAADLTREKEIALSVATTWKNVPKILVVDEERANADALIHLNAGADGIWFDLHSQSVKFDSLLSNIQLPFCSVFFQVTNAAEAIMESLATYVTRKSSQDEIKGAFFSDLQGQQIRRWKHFSPCGIIAKENINIVDEIVDSLLTAVDSIRKLTQKNFSTEDAFRSISFSISVDEDFFLSAAKIRALKNLWLTLQESYGVKKPAVAFIHADSKRWINENYQPHGNMLKQTTGAMAAVMGGCDALSVESEQEGNTM